MKLLRQVGPIVEPVTEAEMKMHLRVDSETFDGNLSITQCLSFASHAVADNYTTHVGTGVDVLGKQAEVLLHCGSNGVGGTNDTKIQESDDDVTYTDFTDGAFAQVTTANDNADYKIAYTGVKQYIRTVSKVLVAACEFGTSILVNEATMSEDDLINSLIATARENIEDYTRRALLTQTWDYCLDEWPKENYITLPFGNLQSVTSVKWKDDDGDETTLTENTDYIVETNGEQCGRIVLPFGETWPSGDLYPSNPITIKFVCGWTAAANVPYRIKAALKILVADMWENRGELIVGQLVSSFSENKTWKRLIYPLRLWDMF